MAGEEHEHGDSPAEAPAPPAAPPPAARRTRFVWPALCLFQLGLLVGTWCMRPAPPEPEENVAPRPAARQAAAKAEEKKDAAPPAPAKRGPAGEFRRGDELLRQGQYQLALAAYPPPTACTGAARDQLHYRLALCLEGAGRLEEALARCRDLTDPGIEGPARVCQARLWLRLGRPAEAKALLYPLLLCAAAPDFAERPFLADAHYLLARALVVEARPSRKAAPPLAARIDPPEPDWPLADCLAWVAAEEDKRPARKGPAFGLAARGAPAAGGEALVGGTVPRAPVAGLIELALGLGKLRVEWTPAARQRVAGRTAVLAVEGRPVLTVLRDLADPLDVVWTAKAGVVSLTAADEAVPGALAAHRAALAGRALREAILAYPGHPLAGPSYVELGNLEADAGKLPAASGWYERLLREAPRSALAAAAGFNLGVVQAKLGNGPAARRALYRVVDRAPGGPLAPPAYVLVGQTYLEEGQPREAIRPLGRGLAPGSPAGPAAALALAAAHLLNGSPQAAHEALAGKRERLGAEPYRRTAAFLDALARYRAAAGRKQAAHLEAGELLAALLEVPPETSLGPVAPLLAGQAYAELGLDEQMARLYDRALPAARGLVAAEMTYRLAEFWYPGDKRPAALRLLATLAAQGDGAWAVKARLKLATVALQDNRPRDCVEQCRGLLQGAGDRATVLRLMGDAFERLGEHQQAARCYGGQAPE